MKKLLLGLLFFLPAMAQAQIYGPDTKFGTEHNRSNSLLALGVPRDTFSVPLDKQGYPHIAIKQNQLYIWDTTTGSRRWNAFVSGSPNSNIGSGYRLAVPGTNNVKTLFAGYGIIKDSTSNANAITTKLDTATVFPAIRATIPGGSGSTELAHQGLVKNGDYIGLDSNGVNPLTRDVLINADNRKITFENDRGSFVFDNPSQSLVKLNGTGSAALFQADSAGVNRMRLMPRGQLALGDSVNLSIYIGHNSGLNYAPQGAAGNPPGRWNNSHGTNVFENLTIGNDNNGFGTNALRYLVDGTHNVGISTAALLGCVSCHDMIMIGVDGGANHINSIRGTGTGSYTQYLSKGSFNTTTGYGTMYGQAGQTDHTGEYNTISGYRGMLQARSASGTTGSGYDVFYNLTTGGGWGGYNTGMGGKAGYNYNKDFGLFLGFAAGQYHVTETNAFYLHTLDGGGIVDEATGKQYSMFYGTFGTFGSNQLRMNGKYGINTLPDSAFHVVGNSWLNGKLRITDGTQANGYVLTSDANGNASWQASSSGFTNPMTTAGDLILATTGGSATRLGIGANGYVLTSNGTTASWQAASGGGGTPAGNYGNIQLNRNSTFATPGSDSLGYTTSAGLFVHNNMSVGNAANNVATLNIAAKDGEGKLAFKYSTTDYGYFKVNTASGQVSIGSDQYPVTLNSSSTVTINNDLALNTTSLGLGRKMSLRYTGVEYGYFAIETNNAEFRAVSPNTYDFTWRGGSGELMRLKESNGSLGIGTSSPNSKLDVSGSVGAAITTTTTNLTLDATHHTVIVTSGTPTITLPAAASGNSRRIYVIVNQTGSGVTISSYLDFTGAGNTTVGANSAIQIQSNGTNWYRIL